MPETPTSSREDTRTDQAPATEKVRASPDNPRRLARNFAIGLTIYVVLMVGYFSVLRLLSEPLLKLYDSRVGVYALVALGLIVTQGLVLESVTSLLAEYLGIVTHED